MLEFIDTTEKILKLSIPEIKYILSESKRLKPGPDLSFDYDDYFRNLEEGVILIELQTFLIERRLATPNRKIQDAPRPVHVPLVKVICQEHRQLHRYLRVFRAEVLERNDTIQGALRNGWYQGIF